MTVEVKIQNSEKFNFIRKSFKIPGGTVKSHEISIFSSLI